MNLESKKQIMNNALKKGLLFLSILLIISKLSYSQETLFEFGTSTSMDAVLSKAKEKENKLKWVNVNTTKETWKLMKDGTLSNTGLPIGVIRSEKQYENFILHVEWKHMEAGGNSGVFAWSGAKPIGKNPLPDGVEIQMLDLEWVDLNIRNGVKPPIAYVHGELFGVQGVTTIADNPRGDRSKSIENRVKGKGEWNTYDVVCVDGVIKLSVNGKFVNGIRKSSQKKGYLCLESEGAQIFYRNLKVIELAPGVTSVAETAALLP